MQSRHLAAFLFAAACGNLATPPPPVAALPWVSGFEATAVGELATPAGAQRIAELLHTGTGDDATAIEVHADVAGDATPETVLASYALGVVVVDARGRVIATAPGLLPRGSADDVVAVVVGGGGGGPVIAVATQTGGHRESVVNLAVYRVGAGKTLEPIFGTQRSRKIAWQ